MNPRMVVAFESRSRSRRRWEAVFEMGSEMANNTAALRVAHTHNARIVSVDGYICGASPIRPAPRRLSAVDQVRGIGE